MFRWRQVVFELLNGIRALPGVVFVSTLIPLASGVTNVGGEYGDATVSLSGHLAVLSGTVSVAASKIEDVIGTLPAGYWPGYTSSFPNVGGTNVITIDSGGVIHCGAYGVAMTVSLDGIMFAVA
jgi:hypothetical protein